MDEMEEHLRASGISRRGDGLLTGTRRLTDWLTENADIVGRRHALEGSRHNGPRARAAPNEVASPLRAVSIEKPLTRLSQPQQGTGRPSGTPVLAG